MTLDKGGVVDARGEAHQSSLRRNLSSEGSSNINKTVLGIVLRTYTSDMSKNLMSHYFTDKHSFAAVCDVLVVNDGGPVLWRLSNVMVLPSHPGGLDDFEEHLPRGSSKYINGETFDITNHSHDVNDLDGDWCVVSFIGGNNNVPYISNWWPHPRNSFDPQTSGAGHPNSKGEGKALKQYTQGRGRYFRRINGVEYVVNPKGDIFLSTHYANGDLTPNANGSNTEGRFSRDRNTNQGGGIRVNLKTTQALELNWNEQEEGIGLNDVHDPALPQTNPPQTTPYTKGNKDSLFIRFQNKAAVIETPALFRVDSGGQIRFESVGDTYQIVGGGLNTTVDGVLNSVVDGNIEWSSNAGNISLTAIAGQLLLTSNQEVQLVSEENDVIISSDAANTSVTAFVDLSLSAGRNATTNAIAAISLTAGTTLGLTATGAMTLTAPSFVLAPVGAPVDQAIKGTSFSFVQGPMLLALAAAFTALAAEATIPASSAAATAASQAISQYLIDFPGTLSTVVGIG